MVLPLIKFSTYHENVSSNNEILKKVLIVELIAKYRKLYESRKKYI